MCHEFVLEQEFCKGMFLKREHVTRLQLKITENGIVILVTMPPNPFTLKGLNVIIA